MHPLQCQTQTPKRAYEKWYELKKGKICEEFSIYCLCNIATIDFVIRLCIEFFPYNLEYKTIYGILYLP